jgi:hypothetical protein
VGEASASAFARPRSPRGTPPALALPHEGGGNPILLEIYDMLLIHRHCPHGPFPLVQARDPDTILLRSLSTRHAQMG